MNKTKRMKVVETGDFAGEIKPVIHPVVHSRQLFEVYRLTHECYSANGSHLPSLDGIWIPHPEFDHIVETTILVAELDGQIVGTVSITKDGPRGLPADKQFGPTCALMRSSRRRLAQVWRLLVRESCPLKQPISTSLLSAAVHHLLSEEIQTTLFFIQDKHAELCRKLLNAITLVRTGNGRGQPNACDTLLRSDLENLKSDLKSKNAASNRRSLEPIFSV
jgi:N-acyl amino acid synthase FeeM